jgi:hypothetical protein
MLFCGADRQTDRRTGKQSLFAYAIGFRKGCRKETNWREKRNLLIAGRGLQVKVYRKVSRIIK